MGIIKIDQMIDRRCSVADVVDHNKIYKFILISDALLF